MPPSYSWVPTGNRSTADGSPLMGGATQADFTSCTVEPWQVPTICQMSTVAPCGIGLVNATTGPLPSPVFSRFTNTLICAPGTNSVRTITVSPSWTGPTFG